MKGVLLVSIPLLFIAWLLLLVKLINPAVSFGIKFKRRVRKRGWEQHPCRMPAVDNMRKDEIWRCRCGRRWKYLGFHVPTWGGSGTNRWEEWTTEKDLARAQSDLDRAIRELEKETWPPDGRSSDDGSAALA